MSLLSNWLAPGGFAVAIERFLLTMIPLWFRIVAVEKRDARGCVPEESGGKGSQAAFWRRPGIRLDIEVGDDKDKVPPLWSER